MRKLLLLTSVFAITFGAFAQNVSYSQGRATESTLRTVAKENTQQQVLSELQKLLNESLPKMSQQDATIQGAGVSQTMAGMSASNQNAAVLAQQNQAVNTEVNNMNLADMACVLASSTLSAPKLNEHAKSVAREKSAEMSGIINGKAGSLTANGVIDGYVKLDEFRDTASNQTDLMAILGDETIDSATTAYLEKAASIAMATKSINPSVLEANPTNIKVINGLADFARTWGSAGPVAIASISGAKDPLPVAAIKTLNERYAVSGYGENYIQQGISKDKMFDALTYGSTGAAFKIQQFTGSERALIAATANEITNSNIFLFEIYKLLQQIALNTGGTNSLLSADFMHTVVNPLVDNANSGR